MARPEVATELRRAIELLLTIHLRGGDNMAALATEFGFADTAHLESLLRGFQDIDLPDVDPTLFEVLLGDSPGVDTADGEVNVGSPHEIFRTPPRLTVAHALMILTGLQAVTDVGDPGLQRAARSLGKKVRAALVNGAGPEVRGLLDGLATTDASVASLRNATVFQPLRKAAGHRRMHVTVWDDRSTHAESAKIIIALDPIRLVAHDGRTYLFAFDAKHALFTVIPLQDIAHVEETEEPITLPARIPEFNRYLGKSYRFSVQIKITPETAWIPEYYPCQEQDQDRDGERFVTLLVRDREWLECFVRRMGGAVQFRSPN